MAGTVSLPLDEAAASVGAFAIDTESQNTARIISLETGLVHAQNLRGRGDNGCSPRRTLRATLVCFGGDSPSEYKENPHRSQWK